MTHGCLLITDRRLSRSPEGRIERRPRGSIVLHTTHDGMDIPDVVAMAPMTLAKSRGYLWDGSIRPNPTRDDFLDALRRDGSLRGWLIHPASVAALIIATEPCLLVQVPPHEIKHLHEWSGIDSPFVLSILDDDRWAFDFPPGYEETSFEADIQDLFADACEALASQHKEQNQQ